VKSKDEINFIKIKINPQNLSNIPVPINSLKAISR